jgi:hypothetical protein
MSGYLNASEARTVSDASYQKWVKNHAERLMKQTIMPEIRKSAERGYYDCKINRSDLSSKIGEGDVFDSERVLTQATQTLSKLGYQVATMILCPGKLSISWKA